MKKTTPLKNKSSEKTSDRTSSLSIQHTDPNNIPTIAFVWIASPYAGRIRVLPIGQGGSLGRGDNAALHVDAPGVASIHAHLEWQFKPLQGTYELVITDAGTLNGIYVSGMRAQRAILHDGDLIRVGNALALVVEDNAEEYEGPIFYEENLVLGPRSKNSWFAIVQQLQPLPKEQRVVALVGSEGSGRKAVAARLLKAWGVSIDSNHVVETEASSLKFSSLQHSSEISYIVLTGFEGLSLEQQKELVTWLTARPISMPILALFESMTGNISEPLRTFFSTYMPIEIPSIEQRREEIPALIQARLESHGISYHRISIDLYESLTRAAWPGEIEELFSVVDAIAQSHPDEPRLGPEHLTQPLTRRGGYEDRANNNKVSAEQIQSALAAANGSVAAAARILHMSRQNLYREASRLGVDVRRSRDS